MLSLLLAWLFVFIVSTGLGLGVTGLLGRFRLFRAGSNSLGPELTGLAGFCALAWLLSLISLFSGINLYVQLFIFAGALLLLFFQFKAFRSLLSGFYPGPGRPYLFAGLLLLFGGLTLIQAVKPSTFPDSGAYHAQFIQWCQQFAVVPGLGNLHGRLAFNSHAHLLMAFFSWPSAPETPLHQAFGSYLLLLSSCFASRQLTRAVPAVSRSQVFYAGFLVLPYLFFRPFISSPLPDSVVTIFILFAGAMLLEKFGTASVKQADVYSGVLLLLVGTLITFKLSAVFMLLFLALQGRQLAKAVQKAWLGAALGVLTVILVPWLIRNVMLSGHLVYPLPWLDLINVDWKIPAPQVKWEYLEIVHFARQPFGHWRETLHLPLAGWFPSWWATQERHDQALLLVSGGLVLVKGGLLRRRNGRQEPWLAGFLLVSAACSVCWFLTAPALRFGYGYLSLTLLSGTLLILPKQLPKPVFYLTLFLCFAYGLNAIRNELKTARLVASVIWPAPYPRVKATTAYAGRFPIKIKPGDGRCWNLPVPCTFRLAPGLEPRGPRLQDGFRIRVADSR